MLAYKRLFSTIVETIDIKVRINAKTKNAHLEMGKNGSCVVYIQASLPLDTKIFCLSHEIGHYLSWKIGTEISHYPLYFINYVNKHFDDISDEVLDIFRREEILAWMLGEAFLRDLNVKISESFWYKYYLFQSKALQSYGINKGNYNSLVRVPQRVEHSFKWNINLCLV